MRLLLPLTLLFASVAPAFGQLPATSPYNIRAFGAAGDGRTLDSPAINRAIAAAAAAGGGTVVFPAGTYLSVTVRLQSNIALYLDQGAVLLAADPQEGHRYDDPEPNTSDQFQDFGHTHWRNSLIWGENLHDISILGPGLIDGAGLVRSGGQSRSREAQQALRGQAPSGRERGAFGYPGAADAVEPGWGNKTIALKLCRNVLLRDFTIKKGGHFGLLATGVDNLVIDNLKLDVHRDGLDIDACRNVRIANCTVNSPWDDGICLKSTFALGFARPTENVTITNCQVSGYDEGSLLDGTFRREKDPKGYAHDTPTGRIKFGTESNGGFRNITIANCIFEYSRGLALETVDGGPLEDITITNLTMRDIVNAQIFLRLGRRQRAPAGTPPGALRRVLISNVVVHNAAWEHSVIIAGSAGHPIEDVTLSNLQIHYQGGGTGEHAALVVPEQEDGAYPEPAGLGKIMPASGFFIRHARNLTLRDVALFYAREEARPRVVLADVESVMLDGLRAPVVGGGPAVVLRDVRGLTVQRRLGLPDVHRPERIAAAEY